MSKKSVQEIQDQIATLKKEILGMTKDDSASIEDINAKLEQLEALDVELSEAEQGDKVQSKLDALKAEDEALDSHENPGDEVEETEDDTEDDTEEETETDETVDLDAIGEIAEQMSKSNEDLKTNFSQMLDELKNVLGASQEEVEAEAEAASESLSAEDGYKDEPSSSSQLSKFFINTSTNEKSSDGYENFNELMQATLKAAKNAGKGTSGEVISVAKMQRNQSEYKLGNDEGQNLQVINQIRKDFMTGDGALKASLSCCIPPEVSREIPTFCDTSTGAFSKPTVRLDRGSITYPLLSECGYDPKLFEWNDCDPETGEPVDNSANEKECITIECGEDIKLQVNARGICFLYGNADAMFAPEYLEAWISESLCKYNYIAAQMDLDKVLNDPRLPVAACALEGGGLLADLYTTIGAAVDGIRSSLCAGNLTLDVDAPAWISNLLFIDSIKRGGGSQDWISILERDLNIRWNEINHWNPITDPAACAYPDAAEILISAPGSIVTGDGGEIDFGVQRDSALNCKNQVKLMWEEFTCTKFIGPSCSAKKLELTGLCANGAVGPRIDTCSTAASGKKEKE